MPLPIIIGAAALATAVYGAKKGYDGYQKHSEADDIVKAATSRYEDQKDAFEKQEHKTTTELTALGKQELEIGKDFEEFRTLADELLEQLNANRHKKLEINLPEHRLNQIEKYSYTAVGVLGTLAGAGAAGAAAGFAVYGGVMALGAASTGTAISSLAGVAASNATMAAIGGGSLATGGLGIAGGTAILGAAVAAPVLAIAGWAYNSHGEEALKNARKADREADDAIEKLQQAIESLSDTATYVRKIKRVLKSLHTQFNQYFSSLKEINETIEDARHRRVDINVALNELNDSIMHNINNGYALAAILVDVITTPIFKVKKSGSKTVQDENGTPVMDTDQDGSMILNETELDNIIASASEKAKKIQY